MTDRYPTENLDDAECLVCYVAAGRYSFSDYFPSDIPPEVGER